MAKTSAAHTKLNQNSHVDTAVPYDFIWPDEQGLKSQQLALNSDGNMQWVSANYTLDTKYTSFNTSSNVAVEAYSMTVPADALEYDGQFVRIKAWVRFTGNQSPHEFLFHIKMGDKFLIQSEVDSGTSILNSQIAEATVIRTGATTARSRTYILAGPFDAAFGAGVSSPPAIDHVSFDWSTALDVEVLIGHEWSSGSSELEMATVEAIGSALPAPGGGGSVFG